MINYKKIRLKKEIVVDLNISNLLNNIKENTFVQNFINELSNYIQNKNSKKENFTLKQENTLYQVIEKTPNSAYLQDTRTGIITEEKDLNEELLNQITNDCVLSYKDGEYVYEDKLTKDFYDNLIGIEEYKNILNEFLKENRLFENTKYKVEKIENENYLLSYMNNGNKNMIKVPKKLVPYWTSIGDYLYYKNEELVSYKK